MTTCRVLYPSDSLEGLKFVEIFPYGANHEVGISVLLINTFLGS